jgi:hypothetical protein
MEADLHSRYHALMCSTTDEEASYYAYSATLRIHGARLPFQEIETVLGVPRTHRHK